MRRGNYICKASFTDEQALAKLHDDFKEYEENAKIRYAALHLRSQIMKMPKTNTPDPTTVQNLKETALEIPQQLNLFFRTLLGGLTPTHQDTLERKNVLPEDNRFAASTAKEYHKERNRKSFVGNQREIVPFRKPLKSAKFTGMTTSTVSRSTNRRTKEETNLQLKQLDLYWFWELRKGKTPLYAGFMSQYASDPLPIQRICYMDPIPKSPTDNAVVRETMICTMNVAKETGQDWAVVTYDLAVVLKAYSIQAIEQPRFDKLLIMLGNFHTELAFYGAIGTMIN
ncbi:hypothetical protein Pmani_010910 [Petrolisthes manimaculis]|uniref:Uncharacterized protein n=1 Tax=Petrolisthes manimaculis TaxID=1843537 RepID=A0AAE1UBJ6_9EUCA|nr:hypothetical protein Pmani_010910 [Petrolisthes manimaculis]